MKFLSSAFFLLFLITGNCLVAQIETGSEPISFRTGLDVFDDALPEVVVPALDMDQVFIEDEARAETGKPPFYGRRVPMDLNMESNGEWMSLENGDRVWKLKIHAPGALALDLFYDQWLIPEGGQVHLYNPEKGEYIGAYTSATNTKSGYFSTRSISGETTIIEYYEPAAVTGKGRINIQDVGYTYRDLGQLNSRADPCQVDINCPEGQDWQDEKKGVVRLQISVSGGGQSLCSGSLVNNTALDCAPYVLTAFHCVDNVINNQSDLDQMKFNFNYEKFYCDDGIVFGSHFVVGCSIAARSNSGSGYGSDYALLLLHDDVPLQYQPYWNGWNLQSTNVAGGGVGIHHPAGSEKKISTSTQTYVSTAYFGGGPQAYWRVYWAATESGHGVTEGGSSGSPLFDTNKLIVGTLTGGSSYCNSVQPGGQTQPDFYGKMSYHWNQNSGAQTIDLKELLDPLNTGQTVLMGTSAPCSATSIEETDAEVLDQISVFPNPTTGNITIDVSEQYGDMTNIMIYSVVGEEIARIPVNTQVLQYDLSANPSGMYLISFEFANRPTLSQKVAMY